MLNLSLILNCDNWVTNWKCGVIAITPLTLTYNLTRRTRTVISQVMLMGMMFNSIIIIVTKLMMVAVIIVVIMVIQTAIIIIIGIIIGRIGRSI